MVAMGFILQYKCKLEIFLTFNCIYLSQFRTTSISCVEMSYFNIQGELFQYSFVMLSGIALPKSTLLPIDGHLTGSVVDLVKLTSFK